jgi:hypothetical protein
MKCTRGARAILGMQIQASWSTDRLPLANQSREKVTFENNRTKIEILVILLLVITLLLLRIVRVKV